LHQSVCINQFALLLFYCLVFSLNIIPVTINTATPKHPRPIFAQDDPSPVYAFPPNRDTLGGTAYFLTQTDGNILIDSPAWTPETQDFLQAQGVRWLFISHRGNMGKQVLAMQQALSCEVVVQEQEAYLLPGVRLTPFHQEFDFGQGVQAIWTAGHSPGTACLYRPDRAPDPQAIPSGGILFTGRHLLPDRQGHPVPLRTAKTFHWPRQVRHVQSLRDRFTPSTLQHICPGASLGFLRGAHSIADAYTKLSQLDCHQLLSTEAIL
jgi:glyoxylase-like metal-dependent hydrolase (beta-lactamase superfamily II)